MGTLFYSYSTVGSGKIWKSPKLNTHQLVRTKKQEVTRGGDCVQYELYLKLVYEMKSTYQVKCECTGSPRGEKGAVRCENKKINIIPIITITNSTENVALMQRPAKERDSPVPSRSRWSALSRGWRKSRSCGLRCSARPCCASHRTPFWWRRQCPDKAGHSSLEHQTRSPSIDIKIGQLHSS